MENTAEMNVAERMIHNHQTMSNGGGAIRANKELISTLNEDEFIGVLKHVMSGPRSITKNAVEGTNYLWQMAIEKFRKRVSCDSANMNEIEVSGRMILYRQLAHAYEIGLMLVPGLKLTPETNAQDTRRVYPELDRLLHDHHMDDEQEKLKKGTATNIWAYVTKVLYGQWVKTEKLTPKQKTALEKRLGLPMDRLRTFEDHPDAKFPESTVFHVWKHDRSAEKYANVFRHLHANNVKPHEVAEYVDSFSHEIHGKKLAGIEAKDRQDNRIEPKVKKLGKKMIEKFNAFLVRGENLENDDVIEFDKPENIPSSVEFGQAVFKVVGDKMTIVGYETWEQGAYEKHVITRGKAIVEEEARLAKIQEAHEKSLNDATLNLHSEFTHILFKDHQNDAKLLLESGVDMADITAALIEAIKSMSVTSGSVTNSPV